MKRVFVVLLAAMLLLALIPAAVMGADANQLDLDGKLYAGYHKIRIDPSAYPGSPLTGLPMSGYGNTITRLSVGTMDDTGDGKVTEKDGLFITCVAVTDQYDNNVLFFGLDIINANTTWSNPVRTAIVEALQEAGYNVDKDSLYFNGSHTHNGPDLTYGVGFSDAEMAENTTAKIVRSYRNWVSECMVEAALKAMEDRVEVTLSKGVVDASDAIKSMNSKASKNQQRMNWVRHYKSYKDGKAVYGGSNFGYTDNSSTATTMVSEPMDLMNLIQFTPVSGSKKPIVLVNWHAHVTINSSTATTYGNENHYKVSSDWVNNLRYGLEDAGYRASYIQGAAGNTVPTTNVKSLQNPDLLVGGSGGYAAGYLYGKQLAKVAVWGLQNKMTKNLDTSAIRAYSARFYFDTNAPTEEEAALVRQMLAADPELVPEGYADLIAYLTYSATTWSKRSNYYSYFPTLKNMNSRYQLSSARGRMSYLTTAESSITVGVMSIGKDLTFVVSACELADRYSLTDTLSKVTDNDWFDLEDETYGMPVIMGYTNGADGYIPHQLAYTYNEGSTSYAVGSYESQTARYARGTGEKLMVFYDKMLDNLMTDGARIQCECGGKAVNGENGHVCQLKEYLPWSDPNSLPVGGHYYLTTDVTLTKQMTVVHSLYLDMNGHNITLQVQPNQGELAENGKDHNTRVLYMETNSHLSLTDSTRNPGTFSRDLSLLTETQRTKITNYGLLVFLYDNASFTMYDGILDSTGAISGGGSCVCTYNGESLFTMYGGTLKGGLSNNGIIYNRGIVELYGGLITGGRVKSTSASSYYPGIYCVSGTGYTARLVLAGNARVEDNLRNNGTPVNIIYSSSTNMKTNLVVKGNFTGKAGVYVSSPTHEKVVGVSEEATFTAENLMVDNDPNYKFAILDGNLVVDGTRMQCVCGGTLAGKTVEGHTCQEVAFLPCTSSSTLAGEGNYYLTRNVTTTSQTVLTKDFALDLNGYSIIHKPTKSATDTRAFVVNGGSFSITDSTAEPGTVRRNLVNQTQASKDSNRNYGTLILLNDNEAAGNVTVYNGIFDGEGNQAGGGLLANLNTKGAALTIYGGTITGGYSRIIEDKDGYGGAIYSVGNLNVLGGTITGNKAAYGGGIFCSSSTAKFVLGGDAVVSGNTNLEGTAQNNIHNVVTDTTYVRANFTGEAGFTAETMADAKKVAQDEGVNLAKAKFFMDDAPEYEIVKEAGELRMKKVNTAAIMTGIDGQGYKTLAEAVAAYKGEGTFLRLLADNAESVTIPAEAALDLNGFDLTGTVTSQNFYIYDSATDDFTVEDEDGYGQIAVTVTGAQAAEGYLELATDKGRSYHRLVQDIVSVNLQPETVSLYFQSQFNGDEVIKDSIKSYGLAMGLGKAPDFADKTYTACAPDTWTTGKDGGVQNGTLLEKIMKPDQDVEQNRTNATTEICTQPYIELKDGTRILGDQVAMTLRFVVFWGVDEMWDDLTDGQQEAMLKLYETYKPILDRWKIPNIQEAAEKAAEEVA